MEILHGDDETADSETSDRGASLVEYAFLLALIAIVVMTAVTFFGNSVSESFNSSAEEMGAAVSPGP